MADTCSAPNQSETDRLDQRHLECSICSNRFREPKVLDCLHSFCLKCLQDSRQCRDPDSANLLCPVCSHETTLKEVADLPNYFTLSALVEEATIQEQLLGGQGSEIKCQACDEENQAISRCVDCADFLCHDCQRAHERLAVMKSHKIYTLSRIRSGEIVYESQLREHVPKCVKHREQNLSIYCTTCEELVCTTCSVLDHGNLKHSLVGLPEASDKCKQDIVQLATTAGRNKTELCVAMDKTGESRKKLDIAFADTNNKISTKAEEEVARIRQEERSLKCKLEEIYNDRIKTFENAQDAQRKEVAKAESKLDEVNQVVAQSSCCEILAFKKRLLHNLRLITGKPPKTVPDTLSFMDFEEGEKSLGSLVLDEEQKVKSEAPGKGSLRPRRWELKTELKTFGPKQKAFKGVYDIAVFSNNELVMADTKQKQLFTFSMQNRPHSRSPVTPQRLQITGLAHPSRVSVNKNDHLIVLDGPTVKIFSREYQLLHQFTPSQGPNSMPACLAVDDNDQIAVGYHLKGEISLHNPDGSPIKTLPAPMIDFYLAVCEQQLVYTNIRQKRLLSVDYNGEMVRELDINSMMHMNWNPVSICHDDSDGSIYVAGCRGILKSSGEIHRFGPRGEYIGCIIKGCGSPCGIKLTPDGDLVVAGGHFVKIYNRV